MRRRKQLLTAAAALLAMIGLSAVALAVANSVSTTPAPVFVEHRSPSGPGAATKSAP